MRSSIRVLLLLLALFAVCKPAHAAEGYANCTGVISALPKTISTPGTWCLKQGLTIAGTTAKGITIAANNVTLDCNDFTLQGTAGAGASNYGIYSLNRLNAVVRHCNIQGFKFGLYLGSTGTGGNHVVEDNRFSGNFVFGMRIEGDGSVVRRNLVLNTGGSAAVATVYGIYAAGSVNLEDNVVSGVAARVGSKGSAYGIYTSGNISASIDANEVRGLAKDGTGKDYGIYNAASGRVTMRNNDVFAEAGGGGVGLTCTDVTGRAKNNIIDGFATAMSKCGDSGENDAYP